MTRTTFAAAIPSALVLIGVFTHGLLTLADAHSDYNVIETHSDLPGISAVTITGSSSDSRLEATIRFRTDPAQRPDPKIVVSTDRANPALFADALAQGNIVATMTSSPDMGDPAKVPSTLAQILRDAQRSDTGPFGQIFTNPTMPPPSRNTD